MANFGARVWEIVVFGRREASVTRPRFFECFIALGGTGLVKEKSWYCGADQSYCLLLPDGEFSGLHVLVYQEQ